MCFLVLLSALSSQAQITPSGDSYTASPDPHTNYGATTTLMVDGAKGIGYIQFNLASIPAGATVSQATLKLFVNGVTIPGTFNVDYVDGEWSEATLTYDTAPALWRGHKTALLPSHSTLAATGPTLAP